MPDRVIFASQKSTFFGYRGCLWRWSVTSFWCFPAALGDAIRECASPASAVCAHGLGWSGGRAVLAGRYAASANPQRFDHNPVRCEFVRVSRLSSNPKKQAKIRMKIGHINEAFKWQKSEGFRNVWRSWYPSIRGRQWVGVGSQGTSKESETYGRLASLLKPGLGDAYSEVTVP